MARNFLTARRFPLFPQSILEPSAQCIRGAGLLSGLHIRRTCRHAACERLSEGFMARVFKSWHRYST
jgi:hypothetical protein